MKKPEQNASSHPHYDALRPSLETLLSLAKKAGADQADALCAHGRSLSIGVRGGELEDIDNSEGKDIGLRVFIGQRQACVSSSDLSQLSLEKLAERAVAMAKIAPEDPYCGLADQANLSTSNPDIDVFDPTELQPDALLERARETEAACLAGDNVQQAEGANAHTASSALFFMTSDGFANGWRSSQHGLSVSAIASDSSNGGMERDYDYDSARYFDDLKSPQEVGNKAAARAAARLGAVQMASASMPILFERRVASALISSFVSAICGPAIARGVSFLKDDLGKQVFKDNIQIHDAPLRRRGLGSHPWDGEGVTSAPLSLIKDGILQTWLLNTAYGKQLGMKTTGHAARGMSSPPGVASSNIIMSAGEQSPADLIKSIDHGLSITEMFGPSINANTGDFSVGVAGFAIVNGERTHAVNEITIAANLRDMFMAMTPASDLIFDQPISAPSLLIDEMVVAGS